MMWLELTLRRGEVDKDVHRCPSFSFITSALRPEAFQSLIRRYVCQAKASSPPIFAMISSLDDDDTNILGQEKVSHANCP
jgi:hypothetical protein